MAPSPPKPWEKQTTAAALTASSAAPSTAVTSTSSAPPVPSRTYDSDSVLNPSNPPPYSSPFNNSYSGYGGYGGLGAYSSPYSRFGTMGNSMYGYTSPMYGSPYGGIMGYGGYNSFGGYGMGDPNDPNSLARRMEAGTQATFQIIESIVGAFGGFAQMLESTFMATHSSFFAMVSVAEQFGNLKETLGSVFGIYAMMRYIRVAIAKLRGTPLPSEEISTNDFSSFNDSNTHPPRASRKPLIIFLLAVFGLPYLMSKLIRSMASSQSHSLSNPPFEPQNVQFYRAIFDFIPRNPASEIALRKGDIVAVTSLTESNWWRARTRDGREGYVPATYLEIVHDPTQKAVEPPAGEQGHAFIEEFKDEQK